ncbi:response regulator transcription factor [Treponema parvum]|uniref:response regulator transcription factor n=1 Tax=Treponema parvum TaxID=138851 RepID=UPI001AEBEC64|nr:response regulator transcription factor [Treponema parvum]QTQ16320.1 response regulator transcription factor [Treponema parvum]
MDPHILVIEDVPEMADLISLYLKKSDMTVTTAGTAEKALEILDTIRPDLLLLDLNLPGMSGFDFLERFRKKYGTSVPVIIVSARDSDEDIINGLGIGADEFVTKPFSPRVLVARVESSLRRKAETAAAAEECIKFGNFTVLLNSCVLKQGAVKIPLSTKEYEMLEYILKHKGQTLSPETIYKDVWKNRYGDLTAVAVYVQRLRKKIEKDPADPVYIKTVFGQGYRFEDPDK